MRALKRANVFVPFEVNGFEERARHMIDIAPWSLRPIIPQVKTGCTRYIQHYLTHSSTKLLASRQHLTIRLTTTFNYSSHD